MDLPVVPPVPPMLARLTRTLPREGYLYEPKWDGFRCIAFRSGDEVELQSRNGRGLARYFPELVEALTALPHGRFVLDGEILATGPGGFDFEALLARLHPAPSRVARLRRETPAMLVAFDLLATGDADLRERPLEERREGLARLVPGSRGALHLTPCTEDPLVADEWLERFQGGGIDGVVAKPRRSPYQPGKRAMVKVKRQRTAECVVGGFRVFAGVPALASLLLGLFDDAGDLRHVGVVSAFSDRRREELVEELRPLVVPLEGHPWEHGFLIQPSRLGRLRGAAGRWTPEDHRDWVPVRPDRVCEVAFDQVEAGRFRHAAQFVRWRPDRDPPSCTLDQIEAAAPDLTRILARP